MFIITIVYIAIVLSFYVWGLGYIIPSPKNSSRAATELLFFSVVLALFGSLSETIRVVVVGYTGIIVFVFLLNKLFDYLGTIIGIVASPLWLVYCLIKRKRAAAKSPQSSIVKAKDAQPIPQND